ncbi:Immunogenic protein MPT70 precursor [Planctomycetes bacterium Pan216]|uniref:Immunogenic protein MPT70 n=1 Tax=Kolteria novifilia TaxID=2527975 RepID=A0A518B8Y7_9BACT|nr:Immunogenic protein MPT70 precursor [Planctomycetes bacterium Pan216]
MLVSPLNRAIAATLVATTCALASANAEKKDIVDTAVGAGDFQTLVTAVKTAGLVETLKSDGPFTVFAPTDAAFAKLPEGTVEKLLKDKEKLKSILLYHVVAGDFPASAVVKEKQLESALGQPLTVKVSGDGVTIDNAKVAKADIECSNGVIHVIDEVLLPTAEKKGAAKVPANSSDDIVGVAQSAGSFNTLLTAAKEAGIVEALRADGPITVFAPTDDAFAKLPAGTLDSLLKDKEALTRVLTYHVVPGDVSSAELVTKHAVATLLGESAPVQVSKDCQGTIQRVAVGGAKVIKADIHASNGIIHVVDSVMMPH